MHVFSSLLCIIGCVDGEWLVEVERDVTEALGEVADYLVNRTKPSPSINNEE
jgi:hypothetical protein